MGDDVALKLGSYKTLEFGREGFSGDVFEGSDGKLHVRVRFQVFAESLVDLGIIESDAVLTDKVLDAAKEAFHAARDHANLLTNR